MTITVPRPFHIPNPSGPTWPPAPATVPLAGDMLPSPMSRTTVLSFLRRERSPGPGRVRVHVARRRRPRRVVDAGHRVGIGDEHLPLEPVRVAEEERELLAEVGHEGVRRTPRHQA